MPAERSGSNPVAIGAKRFIFIGGAEGSGTTLLRRILAAPRCCASHGRDIAKLPDHPDALPLFQSFEQANQRLWDRHLSLAEHEQARQEFHRFASAMVGSPAFADCSHFIFKRSFPFGGGDTHRPDLFDAIAMPGDCRIVLIYRDPRAATYSALRRGFDTDLRRLAQRCADHLTWLAGQVAAIGRERVLIISYRRLCLTPAAELARLAGFCALPLAVEALPELLQDETDTRYRRELSGSDLAWLDDFFGQRRIRQWSALAE